jgi:hypothetical protein
MRRIQAIFHLYPDGDSFQLLRLSYILIDSHLSFQNHLGEGFCKPLYLILKDKE